jgi:hypothetical protein
MAMKDTFNPPPATSVSPPEDADRAEALEMLQAAKDAMAEMKEELRGAKRGLAAIVEGNGGDPNKPADVEKAKQAYKATLKVHVIDNCDSEKNKELMTRMYDLYASVFPLEEEREELGKLLQINKTKTTEAPSLEQWILLEDPTGKIVGARNVMNLSAAKDPEVAKDIDGSQSLVYSFVDPKYRSLGLGDYTLSIAEQAGRKFFAETEGKGRNPDTIDMIQVAEQNAPLIMPMEAILVDTAGAKTDQFWRRFYYESLGFRELDFNYVQVPLVPRDEGGVPGEGMNLIVRGSPGPESARHIDAQPEKLPADVVKFHLKNYAAYVAAGQYDLDKDPDWVAQKAALDQKQAAGGTVGVKPKLDFMALKDSTWDFMEKFIKSKSFTKDSFQEAAIGELMGVERIPAAPAVQAKQPKAAPLPKTPGGQGAGVNP